MFYPHAPPHRARPLPSLYRRFEGEKKHEYGERVNDVEHGSFTPLVFSLCGGMGPEAAVVIKKLANALATKRCVVYSRVVSWLRRCLSFSLARSALVAMLLVFLLGQVSHMVHLWLAVCSPSNFRPRACGPRPSRGSSDPDLD